MKELDKSMSRSGERDEELVKDSGSESSSHTQRVPFQDITNVDVMSSSLLPCVHPSINPLGLSHKGNQGKVPLNRIRQKSMQFFTNVTFKSSSFVPSKSPSKNTPCVTNVVNKRKLPPSWNLPKTNQAVMNATDVTTSSSLASISSSDKSSSVAIIGNKRKLPPSWSVQKAPQVVRNSNVITKSPSLPLESSSAKPSTVSIDGNKNKLPANRNRVVSKVVNGKQVNLHDSSEYFDVGDPTNKCDFCGSYFWYHERQEKQYKAKKPTYSVCCSSGKIQLSKLKEPPQFLNDLLFGNNASSKHFKENIRSFNSMFSFTSMGGKLEFGVNNGTCPPVFKLSGQNYHRIGSLIPSDSQTPKFAQLYIYDTENEVANRIMSVRKLKEVGTIKSGIVEGLKTMLDHNNVLVKCFRMARDKFNSSGSTDIKLRLIYKRSTDARTYNLPSTSEVAALIVGDLDADFGHRDILVECNNGELKYINELHPSYLPLQYPLLFPFGEDGYREDIPFSNLNNSASRVRKKVSIREFIVYRLHERACESNHILSTKRLFQQFVVDAYTMIESSRLNFIRFNQASLRSESYKGLTDAYLRGETDSTTQGRRIVLPSTFVGGARYMIQNYQDAMAICKWAGYPNLFITFTCNPRWREIVRYVEGHGLRAEDRPDVVCRIFKGKLDQLMRDLCKNKIFGSIKAAIYTIEFQKRGLPHAHILLFLAGADRCSSGEDIDRIISAEIPNQVTEESYYNNVCEFMVHGPCGEARRSSPCMTEGKCTKHFPKKFVKETSIDEDGYPVYRRRDNGRTITKNGVDLDNRYVVPHNKHLLMKYGGHLNVEWCNQSRSIKYLFKYISKGNDRVTASFSQSAEDETHGKQVDEINMYYNCRYISPCEAVWRIFSFDINYRTPPVERLNFHLPNEQNICFKDNDAIETVINRPTVGDSMFLAWFEANKIYPEARELTYYEFPTKFVWIQDGRYWKPRKRGMSIGRIYFVHPGTGEKYYLRLLLNIVRGPTCFEDIRTVEGVLYDTFRDACYALGLLDDDKEYVDGITEASHWASAHSLRHLFANLLTANSMTRPDVVWENCWSFLSDDVLHKQRQLRRVHDLKLTELQIKNHALAELEKILRNCGRSLRDYTVMPFPEDEYLVERGNNLINDELQYDRTQLATEHISLLGNLTDEQRIVYNKITKKLESDYGGVFFVYGYGGTGKTFIWKTLSAAVRSKGDIVLNVASSGIASLLLPGGRTAHSRFAIPIGPSEDSTCNVKQGSHLAELLVRCKLIIWDEAPMTHKHCFEALDKTLKDIMQLSNPSGYNLPFGGKTVVFGGDFRQILPVIPKGSREDVVNATINASYLWKNVQLLTLTRNMRLRSAKSLLEANEIQEFSDWVAALGDGDLGGPNDGHATIDIPEDIHLPFSSDPIATIVNATYPSSSASSTDLSYLQERAILAPTLDVVDSINQYMISMNQSESKVYLSSDSTCNSDGVSNILNDVHTPEFLNGLKCSGLPNHELILKVGTPVMLLRNIDHSLGLCNGTRMVITRLGNHVLEAEMLSGNGSGEKVLLSRMSITPSDPRIPFKFQRKQFPLIVSYAMTINKSQGQSLSHVGIFLKKPVFTHGQLYVAVSRVRSRAGLKILSCDKNNNSISTTKNVVYREVFPKKDR